jgi:hypothetical protein
VTEARPGGGGAAGWRRRGRLAEARPGGGGAAGWLRRGRVAEARPGGAHIFLWATFFVFLSRRYSLPRSG